MRIAFFTYLPLEYGGGVAKYFLETAPELQKRLQGAQITIITLDENFLRRILFIYTLYFWGKQDQHEKVLEPTTQIKKQLGAVKYLKIGSIAELSRTISSQDAFYTTNNLFELLLLKLLSFKQKLPHIIIVFHIPVVYSISTTLHTKFHNFIYTSFLYRKLLSKTWTLHVLNRSVKKYVSLYFPSRSIKFIPTPFRPRLYSSEKRKPKKNTILWIGRLTEQKGINYLIQIVNEVNVKVKKRVRWTIAGNGEERAKIEELQKKWQNVHYLGYIKNKDLPNLYAEHDLFVMTSISEAYPYTLLEAQSMGLPIICFDIPGCQDIVTTGKTGYVVKDKTEFVKKIVEYAEGSSRMHVKQIDTYEERWDGLQKLFITS